MLLEVLGSFQDKYDPTVMYNPGDTFQTDDLDRINDLVSRRLAKIACVENVQPAETKEKELKKNKPAPKVSKEKEKKETEKQQ
jgi:hypothetical protein